MALDREKYLAGKRRYYEKHKKAISAKRRAYYQSHKEQESLKNKQYVLNNKEQILENKRVYYSHNKERFQKYNKKYYEIHKDEIIDRQVKRNKKRKKTDVHFKLKCSLRRRLGNALRGDCKAGSFIQDLGCSIEEFKIYLESKFQKGMSWSNYGFYGWHIDHIIPLDHFDLTNKKEFKKAAHFTNTQPMWWRENISKGAMIGS